MSYCGINLEEYLNTQAKYSDETYTTSEDRFKEVEYPSMPPPKIKHLTLGKELFLFHIHLKFGTSRIY